MKDIWMEKAREILFNGEDKLDRINTAKSYNDLITRIATALEEVAREESDKWSSAIGEASRQVEASDSLFRKQQKQLSEKEAELGKLGIDYSIRLIERDSAIKKIASLEQKLEAMTINLKEVVEDRDLIAKVKFRIEKKLEESESLRKQISQQRIRTFDKLNECEQKLEKAVRVIYYGLANGTVDYERWRKDAKAVVTEIEGKELSEDKK